jgi:hypothetical protein
MIRTDIAFFKIQIAPTKTNYLEAIKIADTVSQLSLLSNQVVS